MKTLFLAHLYTLSTTWVPRHCSSLQLLKPTYWRVGTRGMILLMVQKSSVHRWRLVVHPIFYRVLLEKIPGGCLGFLPSTVWPMGSMYIWYIYLHERLIFYGFPVGTNPHGSYGWWTDLSRKYLNCFDHKIMLRHFLRTTKGTQEQLPHQKEKTTNHTKPRSECQFPWCLGWRQQKVWNLEQHVI